MTDNVRLRMFAFGPKRTFEPQKESPATVVGFSIINELPLLAELERSESTHNGGLRRAGRCGRLVAYNHFQAGPPPTPLRSTENV